ncbi:MAG: YCF48-related protein [Gemmataceae bacterium]
MRTLFAGLMLLLAGLPAEAADTRHFEDATLHAIHFADDREGWAVGDEGVIWHTIDAGKSWERQPSGTRASLRSVYFVDPYIGWIAGREELPGGGSTGVVLYTSNGGQSWRRILMNSVPGLHLVRFVGPKTGYLAGDGSEQFPSGVFVTTNAGRDWDPVPGPRATSWRGGDFTAENGALAGAWNKIATLRRGQVQMVDMDSLAGRALTSLVLAGEDGVAVGQGGLVLESRKSRGTSWHFVDTKLGREVMENLDLHAVARVGKRTWAVGRPGSMVLSHDGERWQLLPTNQPLPLHGLYFRDEKHGWAVGELGTILATKDGGQSWTVQQRGGQRLAVLWVHARPNAMKPAVVAALGLDDGYLTGGLCVTAPDPASAERERVSEAARFEMAYRVAGGATAGQLWPFPLGSHLYKADQKTLLGTWNPMHDDRAARLLLMQLILAIRIYRPDVILCDAPTGGLNLLVHEAAKEAFRQAGDPASCPVHREKLGLEAWKPRKLYIPSTSGLVSVDTSAISPRLGTTPREYAADAALLLGQTSPPGVERFTLAASEMQQAENHKTLLQGIALAPGGVARRARTSLEELSPEALRAIRSRTRLWALADAPESSFNRPEAMVSSLGQTVEEMPDEVAARVAHGLGRLYAQRGQWSRAREAFYILTHRYPTHPLAIDGYRWLLMHQASGEVRRRYELGQFIVLAEELHGLPGEAKKPLLAGPQSGAKQAKGAKLPEVPGFESRSLKEIVHRGGREDAKKWLEDCLALEAKLNSFGPLFAGDARVGFAIQSARRQLGQFDETRQWYRDFAARQPEGPWRQIAIGELWLVERRGVPPRPVLACAPVTQRPYLDGKLDEECWRTAQALALQEASGTTKATHPAEARMAYDRDFLYVAVRCAHSAGEQVPLAKPRTRDEDLQKYDRVSLLLDVDRDYNTAFHLQVDARGNLADDCWGDKQWNPRWYVAVHSDDTSWTLEAAIPRGLLTADAPSPGQAWAFNIVRTLPGRGVQALSLPAEAVEAAVRPEGFGLLLFTSDNQATAKLRKREPSQR